MDVILTDDRGQIEDARINEGKFLSVSRIDADNAELVAQGKGNAPTTISVSWRLISVLRSKTLQPPRVYRRAEETGAGIVLEA